MTAEDSVVATVVAREEIRDDNMTAVRSLDMMVLRNQHDVLKLGRSPLPLCDATFIAAHACTMEHGSDARSAVGEQPARWSLLCCKRDRLGQLAFGDF
jgi:hypothetical protein